jgi:hypothetical protein
VKQTRNQELVNKGTSNYERRLTDNVLTMDFGSKDEEQTPHAAKKPKKSGSQISGVASQLEYGDVIAYCHQKKSKTHEP